MDQQWFEMGDIRRQKLNKKVWIPLRAVHKVQTSIPFGYIGYKEEFFGTGSIAVPVDKKDQVEKLGWSEIGIRENQIGYFNEGTYIPSDQHTNYSGELLGIHLVLDQSINSVEIYEWYLHQDLVVTLGIKREGDIWICPSEGYIEVVRLSRNSDGEPNLIEIKAEHLKDYLCGRNMDLYETSYYSRGIIIDDPSYIDWENGSKKENEDNLRWEGRILEIHEGGMPFGKGMKVVHTARIDIDESDDIPDMSNQPTAENTKSKSWNTSYEGRKLFHIIAELWKNEWVDQAEISPRIKRDKLPPLAYFIIDEKGNRVNHEKLIDSGKWLWFKPDVIMTLTHRRGGSLNWLTMDTGTVSCVPDYYVHFGVNNLGLINVFAKDIALLPDWQQQIWAGYNTSPDGGVSDELLASQARAEPANTIAPEDYLKIGLNQLNSISQEKLQISILRNHTLIPEILEKTHRFRAINEVGLLALAKDVARITADNIDTSAIQTIISPPEGKSWRSLKSLENLISLRVPDNIARGILGPLFGAYELRHADAHLPSSELESSFKLLKIDRDLPLIIQGRQLISSCTTSICTILDILKRWDDLPKLSN